MLEISDAPKRDITVQGLILEAPMPYEEGHQLSSNEAGVMNQTWAENLRNNYAAKVKKACEDNKVDEKTADKLPAEVKAAIQKDFASYCVGYEFGVRGTTQADPVKAQATQLAITQVKEALKGKNFKLSEVGTEKIKAMAEEAVEKNPAFMEAAERIVAARRAAAAELTVTLPA